MKKKKAPRRYKPGELVHDAFRMKTREEAHIMEVDDIPAPAFRYRKSR